MTSREKLFLSVCIVLIMAASTAMVRHLSIVPNHYFDVGSNLLTYNISRIFSAICFSLALMGAGHFFLRGIGSASAPYPLSAPDKLLFQFMAGTAALSILGALMGAIGILQLYVVLPMLACFALYFIYCTDISRTVLQLSHTLLKFHGPDRLLLLVALSILLFIFFAKYIYSETFSGDSIGHYFPYMQAISERAHSSQILDVWEGPYSFFLARGSGLSLLFAVLTDGNSTRFVNWLFLFGFFLLFVKLCAYLLPEDGFFGKNGPLPLSLPIAIAIFLISYFTGIVEFQKFRLQDFFWVSAIFTLLILKPIEPKERIHSYQRLILLSCLALTIATPYAMYFVAFCFLISMTRDIQSRNFGEILFAIKTGVISTFVLLASWWHNYTVAGMFDFAPLQFFFPRRNSEIYNLWVSPDVGSMMSFMVDVTPTNYSILFWKPLPLCLLAIISNIAIHFGMANYSKRQPMLPHLKRTVWIVSASLAMYIPMFFLIAVLNSGVSLNRVLGVSWYFHFVILFAGLIAVWDAARSAAIIILQRGRSS